MLELPKKKISAILDIITYETNRIDFIDLVEKKKTQFYKMILTEVFNINSHQLIILITYNKIKFYYIKSITYPCVDLIKDFEELYNSRKYIHTRQHL